MEEYKAGTRGIAEMINTAEFVGRNDMVGEAYYQTRIRGHSFWNQNNNGLSSEQIHILWVGTAKCAEAAEVYKGGWGSQAWDSGNQTYRNFLRGLRKKCHRSNIYGFDLLGRLQAAIAIGRDIRCLWCHPGRCGEGNGDRAGEDMDVF